MLQAWGRRTSPRALSLSRTGATHVRCCLAHNALAVSLAPTDAAPRELAACSSGRTPSVVGQPSAPEKPLTGWITPLKLARLSEVLLLPVTRVEILLQDSPAAVRHMEPEHVAKRLEELCGVLGIPPKQAAFMVSKQPAYMLLTPLSDIRAKLHDLSAVLGVPPAAVLRTVLTVPSILRRSTPFTDRRVRAYSVLLQCTPLDVLHIMARGPEYLSDTPSSVRQRMTALGYVLRRPRCTVAAMLQMRPDLVFMSGKVMNTKVNGLMCIMNKQKHHVVTLVVKLPALLRCNLDSVRHAFGGLQVLLQKREGFVYAMVCHAPALLLLTPRGLHQRCTALRRCLAASPEWREQFTHLRPPGVAQLVLNRRGSLSVMMYLAQRRQAGTASLSQLLSPDLDSGLSKALRETRPDFLEWMKQRRQYVTLCMQQHKVATSWAAERLGRTGPDTQPASANGQVPLLRPQSPPPCVQREQGEVQRPEQRHSALSLAVASASHVAAGEAVAAMAIGVHLGAGSLPRRAQADLGGARLHVPFRLQPSDSASEPTGSCSISSGGNRNSSRTCSSSRGSEGEREGVLRQDAYEYVAAGREQQQGASTSGRQPSWLQLQTEYRRNLRSRSRRKVDAALQAPGMAERKVALDTGTSLFIKRARKQRKALPRRFDLPAPTVAEEEPPAATSQAAPLGADPKAPGQSLQHLAKGPSGFGSSTPHSVPLASASAVAISTGSDFRHLAAHGCAGALLSCEVLDTTRAAQSDSSPGRQDNVSDLHPPGNGQQSQQHVRNSLRWPQDRQEPVRLQSRGIANVSPEAAGLKEILDAKEGALAVPPIALRGFRHPPHKATCLEREPGDPAISCALTSTESVGIGVGWPCSDGSGTDDVANHHSVGQKERRIPMWLQLDSSGASSSVAGQAHRSAGDGTYELEDMHQEDSEAHGSRRVAAPPTERAQHGSTNEVVVVSGDGSIRDIKGLGRDSHALGLRGQEPGVGLSIGQAQKFESALGATVPR